MMAIFSLKGFLFVSCNKGTAFESFIKKFSLYETVASVNGVNFITAMPLITKIKVLWLLLCMNFMTKYWMESVVVWRYFDVG